MNETNENTTKRRDKKECRSFLIEIIVEYELKMGHTLPATHTHALRIYINYVKINKEMKREVKKKCVYISTVHMLAG